MPSPTIVLVHGAFADSQSFQQLQSEREPSAPTTATADHANAASPGG